VNVGSFVDYKGRPKSSFPFKKSYKIKNKGMLNRHCFNVKILEILCISLKQ